jgi:hypothetical protein
MDDTIRDASNKRDVAEAPQRLDKARWKEGDTVRRRQVD